ncbi:hypothetical protein SS50377_22462 [Spironucleus salmonicida]|uniref:Uncharacterized protein n=1 Tax=Spironucleus salmonicida TaxID=348837 RepID=V6LC51_9EUKA|nr:hypothetical protein SS50377_22462 [Spironucleus salmonicida]|eukprot:EST42047.1 Hypothetical protein SS50377_18354 [Spironucleus salmonicida]
MQNQVLDPQYRLFSNPYFNSFLFYSDNTLFQTNELFEIISQTPLPNFPHIANQGLFAPAYRYVTYYIDGKVIGQVLNHLYEFTETGVIAICQLPLKVVQEQDTYGKIAPIGSGIAVLAEKLFIGRMPDFQFRAAESVFQGVRIFGFMRSALLWTPHAVCQIQLQDSRLIQGPPLPLQSEFLCCSGGLLFLQTGDKFTIIDIAAMKFTEGPESHVRDFDEVVKLYTTGILPGTFLKLTRFHVQNFETKFHRWRKAIDDGEKPQPRSIITQIPRTSTGRRQLSMDEVQRNQVAVQQQMQVHMFPGQSVSINAVTQTEDSECICQEAARQAGDEFEEIGDVADVKIDGKTFAYRVQVSEKIVAYYRQKNQLMERRKNKEITDPKAILAIEALAKFGRK